MKKILLGGSPCTFWSKIKLVGREVEAEGQGWELFTNYAIAKEKFNPDFFFYENNMSASKEIKQAISTVLGHDIFPCNSNLVSAQNRNRFYVFNWDATLPEDRNIYLDDILESNYPLKNEGHSPTVKKGLAKIVNKYGYVPQKFNAYNASIITNKSPTLSTGSMVTSSCATLIFVPAPNGMDDYYIVKDGFIYFEDNVYPSQFQDGKYFIRKLTINEQETLQNLPKDYTSGVSYNQRSKAIGNGWTAEVVIHLLGLGLKDVPRDEELIVLSMYDGIATGRYCLDRLGFTNIKYIAYEIDEAPIKIAMKNYPDIIQCGNAFDLRKDNWNWKKLLDKFQNI